MSNEPLGLYEEAKRRAEYYGGQNNALRKRILGQDPASNGATAETKNPFQPEDQPVPVAATEESLPRLPYQSQPPFWRLHGNHRRLRRVGDCDDPADILDVSSLQVIQAVCLLTDLSPATLVKPDRSRRVSRPRQVALYFIGRYTQLSLKQIAYTFSMDHTTVMHAIRIVPRRIAAGCSETKALVDKVEAMLRTPK